MTSRPMIGLEVHVELDTASKIFCPCSTKFGAQPNTQVCPVCLGLPGSLPVLNQRAVELAVRAGLVLNCTINQQARFDRKNYHYPDLPKGYQISQYDHPVAERGHLAYMLEGKPHSARIRRVHLEEDAGKLVHEEGEGAGTLVDFNRCGLPLAEIVTEPDFSSASQVRAFLEDLRRLLRYVGVSQVKMEEGQMRCDVNVSLVTQEDGEEKPGTVVEMKNLSSFREVQRALEFEIDRQRRVLAAGGRVLRETRHWDEGRGVSLPSRTKEEMHDYRYFPEPDLLLVDIDETCVDRIRGSLAETPQQRRERYVAELGLPEYDSAVLIDNPSLAAYFEELLAAGADPRTASKWVLGEIAAFANARGGSLDQLLVPPASLVELMRLVEDDLISTSVAKQVFAQASETGDPPGLIVEREGLRQISDVARLRELADQVVRDNPQVVVDYLGGKERALGYLMGQMMKETRGKANPREASRILREKLRQVSARPGKEGDQPVV